DSYVTNSGKSVNFLVETLEVKPGAFKASTTAANGQNYTKFTASVPNVSAIAGAEYAGANWYQDSPTTNLASGTAVGGFNNGVYTASTGFMTFEDTLAGDADGNGAVNISD